MNYTMTYYSIIIIPNNDNNTCIKAEVAVSEKHDRHRTIPDFL